MSAGLRLPPIASGICRRANKHLFIPLATTTAEKPLSSTRNERPDASNNYSGDVRRRRSFARVDCMLRITTLHFPPPRSRPQSYTSTSIVVAQPLGRALIGTIVSCLSSPSIHFVYSLLYFSLFPLSISLINLLHVLTTLSVPPGPALAPNGKSSLPSTNLIDSSCRATTFQRQQQKRNSICHKHTYLQRCRNSLYSTTIHTSLHLFRHSSINNPNTISRLLSIHHRQWNNIKNRRHGIKHQYLPTPTNKYPPHSHDTPTPSKCRASPR